MKMLVLKYCLINQVILLLKIVIAQKVSPCPDILSYTPRRITERTNRWKATIDLNTPNELRGIWLKVILDKKADLLGVAQHFGNVTTNDNREYLIKNENYILDKDITLQVRIFVKYKIGMEPNVEEIHLDGRIICKLEKPSQFSEMKMENRPFFDPPPILSSGEFEENPMKDDLFTEKPTTDGSTNLVTSLQSSIPDILKSDWWTASDPVTQSHTATKLPTKRPVREDKHVNQTVSDQTTISPNKHVHHEPKDEEGWVVGDDSNYLFDGTNYQYIPNLMCGGDPGEDDDYSAQCGTIGRISRPMLLGAQNTTPGQFPWHVAIYRFDGVNQVYICGGSLISRQHVLTAAHCVYNDYYQAYDDKSDFIIYLGKFQLKHMGCETQERSVSAVYGHSDYNPSTFHNDIAILRLSHKVLITEFVKPVCLWDENRDLDSIEGVAGTVVGWGYSIYKQMSNHLMQAKMPIVPMWMCTRNSRISFNGAICAGFANGTSICNGDSGGGLIFPKKCGSHTVWQIRGIGSTTRQRNGICDPEQHVMFTDVAKYLPWIKNMIEKNGY